MAACAENLTPVLMECGGKDALIVDDDADVSAAADAALWGAMSNAGQTCIGIERVYVTERNYEAFVRELTTRARQHRGRDVVRADHDARPAEDHRAARQRRARRGRQGGRRRAPERPAAVRRSGGAGRRAGRRRPRITEETFGPTLTVTKVQGRRRGGRAGERDRLRAGRRGVRQVARRWSWPAGCVPA